MRRLTNKERIAEISTRATWHGNDLLGRACWIDGIEGRVDAVFIDLQAAINVGLISEGWFEAQAEPPATTKSQRWYSVTLPAGAVLLGQREIFQCLQP
jgi:hypothetical protein